MDINDRSESTNDQKQMIKQNTDRFDNQILDWVQYKGKKYVVVDYEDNGFKIDQDVDFKMDGESFLRKTSVRDYVFNLYVVDGNLYGEKVLYDSENSCEWKSRWVKLPYTGRFVIVPRYEHVHICSVVDYLDFSEAFELTFAMGMMGEENDLTSSIAEWRNYAEFHKKDIKTKASFDLKRQLAKKYLYGNYDMVFGYSNLILFFELPDSEEDVYEEFVDDEEMIAEDTENISQYEEEGREKGEATSVRAKEKKKSTSKKMDKQKEKQHKKELQTKKMDKNKSSKMNRFLVKGCNKLSDYCFKHSEKGINNKLSYRLSLKTALQGDQHGMISLARCYYNGIGVSPNIGLALKWFRKSAEENNVIGCHAVFIICEDETSPYFNLKLANRYLRKAADLGDLVAMRQLADQYIIGRGVNKSLAKAKYWYHTAILAGSIKAMYELARLYEYNLKDEENAFQWYLQSAKQGNCNAANKVAFYYETGTGTKQNRKEAYQWYLKAAGWGNEMAKERLLHLNPDGSENIYSYF